MILKDIIAGIQPLDDKLLAAARNHTGKLAIPPRALGRLHDISEKLCAIQGTLKPVVDKKVCLVIAGDHGVAEENISAFPQAVTGEMVRNFLAGGASINALAGEVGAEVWVLDLGIVPIINPTSGPERGRWEVSKISHGTSNLTLGPAMNRRQAQESLQRGFNLAQKAFTAGMDLLGVGDMGIGNTTPSTAIAAVITGKPLSLLVGRGTGLDDRGLAHKHKTIRNALEINLPDPRDGLDVLAKVGGFEIGGIAGCVLAAAFYKHPIVIDGLISTAGALIAQTLCPNVTDYLFAGHCSQEPAHRIMLNHLGLEPILDLDLRLGEGTGAALAMGIIGGAARMFREVLTFEQAGVTAGSS